MEPVDEPWARAIAAGLAALVAAIAFALFVSLTAVDALSPDDRCDACRLGTPRPEPTVVAIVPRPAPALIVPAPAPVIPDTDTE